MCGTGPGRHENGEDSPSPFPTYSATGGWRQGPGRASESPAEAETRTWGWRDVGVVWMGADRINLSTTSAFDLPDHLTAKAAPALIAGDEQHFAAIERTLEQSIADL